MSLLARGRNRGNFMSNISAAAAPSRGTDDAMAKLKEMRRAEEPKGLLEHLLPHETDSGILKVVKYGAAATGAIALGSLALAGAGRVSGSAALAGASSGAMRLAGVTGGLTGLVGLVGGLSGTLGQRNYSEAVEAQQVVVAERSGGHSGMIDVTSRSLMAPYDHNGDGSINIAEVQHMAEDERVAQYYGRVPKDADASIETALRTLRTVDGDGNERVTLAEMQTWVGETYDTDRSGRLSDEERSVHGGNLLPTDHYDDYRDFALGDDR